MGQGSPLPAFLKCDGEWIVENHVYLYYSDNDPAHIAPAPTFGASRHDGAPCVGFDVAHLAAILHVDKTTVLNANHDLALIFLGTADVPPKYGGAIEYQGKLWLVPKWFVSDREGWKTPAYIVCLDHLEVQDLRGKGFPGDFSVPVAIPKAVLDHLLQGEPVAGWTVIDRPPIRFRSPVAH